MLGTPTRVGLKCFALGQAGRAQRRLKPHRSLMGLFCAGLISANARKCTGKRESVRERERERERKKEREREKCAGVAPVLCCCLHVHLTLCTLGGQSSPWTSHTKVWPVLLVSRRGKGRSPIQLLTHHCFFFYCCAGGRGITPKRGRALQTAAAFN